MKAAGTRFILATCLPAAAAILVFGTLYGAAARAILGVPLALASSLLSTPARCSSRSWPC